MSNMRLEKINRLYAFLSRMGERILLETEKYFIIKSYSISISKIKHLVG